MGSDQQVNRKKRSRAGNKVRLAAQSCVRAGLAGLKGWGALDPALAVLALFCNPLRAVVVIIVIAIGIDVIIIVALSYRSFVIASGIASL